MLESSLAVHIQSLGWTPYVEQAQLFVMLLQVELLACWIAPTLVRYVAILVGEALLGIRVRPIDMIVLLLLD